MGRGAGRAWLEAQGEVIVRYGDYVVVALERGTGESFEVTAWRIVRNADSGDEAERLSGYRGWVVSVGPGRKPASPGSRITMAQLAKVKPDEPVFADEDDDYDPDEYDDEGHLLDEDEEEDE